MSKATINARKASVPVDFYPIDGEVLAICQSLNICTYGKDLKDAEASMKELLEGWLESVKARGMLAKTLQSLGWTKQGKSGKVRPPKVFHRDLAVPSLA